MKNNKNKGKFIKIECPECKNKQIIFGKASTKVKCKECKKKVLESKGGKAKIKAKILEVLND